MNSGRTTISNLPFDTDLVHSSASDEQEELAAAFALEALSPEERSDYLVHLDICPVCRRLTGEFQTISDVLPMSLDTQSASVGLKERVLTEAQRDIQPTVRPSAEPQLVQRTQGSWDFFGWLRARPLLAPALMAVVLVALIGWNVSLQNQLRQEPKTPPFQAAIFEALAQGATVSYVPGTDVGGGSTASVIHIPGADRSLLAVFNLQPLPSSQTYQVWRIAGNTPQGVGTFNTLDSQIHLVSLDTDFTEADAIGVSIEPLGGSSAPTGDIVLLGTP